MKPSSKCFNKRSTLIIWKTIPLSIICPIIRDCCLHLKIFEKLLQTSSKSIDRELRRYGKLHSDLPHLTQVVKKLTPIRNLRFFKHFNKSQSLKLPVPHLQQHTINYSDVWEIGSLNFFNLLIRVVFRRRIQIEHLIQVWFNIFKPTMNLSDSSINFINRIKVHSIETLTCCIQTNIQKHCGTVLNLKGVLVSRPIVGSIQEQV